MANTFLAAQGYNMGKSLVEAEALATAQELIAKGGDIIQLPVDLRVADAFAADAENKVVQVTEVPAEWMALDIGPATIAHYSNRLAGAKTVVWNGPMGVFEFPDFRPGHHGHRRDPGRAQGRHHHHRRRRQRGGDP